MGPATLIALGILVVVASIVLNDVSRMRASTSKPRTRPEDESLVPRAVNDPMIVGVQAQVDALAQIVGTAIGTGAGRTTGQAVASAEIGLARGLGSQAITNADLELAIANAYRAGRAGGEASGVNAGGAAGGGVGAGITAAVNSLRSGAYDAARAAERDPVAERYGHVFDPNNIGDTLGGFLAGVGEQRDRLVAAKFPWMVGR